MSGMGVAPSEKKYEDLLKAKLLSLFGATKAKIVFFGSRATGEGRRSSDADIGISGIDQATFRRLRMEFETFWEESIIPFRVDLVHFDHVSEDFKNQALKGGVVWKDD